MDAAASGTITITMRLEFAIDIHRPLRDVFEIVGNLENDPKWQSAVVSATKTTAGPIGEGARFRHVARLMGRPANIDIEFVHHEPGAGYTLHCLSGPLEFDTEVRFQRVARGTRLVTLVQGQAKGLLKLAAVALSHHRQSEIEADLRNLKQLMEAGAL
jgi:uncharacterized membrane protein